MEFVSWDDIPYPIGSMYGIYIYMLTWLGYIDGIHVTIYSSTMDPSWAYEMENTNQLYQLYPTSYFQLYQLYQ